MSEHDETLGFDSVEYLKTLTSRPGVYRMFDSRGQVIYVGKAKNLKKRVASYFSRSDNSPKTRSLVSQIAAIEVTVTHTENEALILENNLIKSLKPRYNILLRDDKSYPYIYLSTTQEFPRLATHRGARKAPGRYFGPYPSGSAVRESLNLLQKLFPIRQCEDSFFANRSRPCLQYQIKRCSGPCVGLIDNNTYAKDVRHVIMFLEGKNQAVIDDLVQAMEQASLNLNYEKAAIYRDQIASLRHVQEKQYISGDGGDLDVVAAHTEGGYACVQVFYFRGGRNIGNKSFYPKQIDQAGPAEVLEAFLSQYYLLRLNSGHAQDIPKEILINIDFDSRQVLQTVLSDSLGHSLHIHCPSRGDKSKWVELARNNAQISLQTHLLSRSSLLKRFEDLQETLALEQLPQRLECFDISHTQGEATVASCVVFDTSGPLKSDYRRFNIDGLPAGDDYAAMEQALIRRYTRLKRGEGKLPDILFIDGGKGQLGRASMVLQELQIEGVLLVGIAKGRERKPGHETLFLSGADVPIILSSKSKALHLIQQIRDEAHRFAITGHKQRRNQARTVSVLEQVPGLGAKRRQQLLKQFGGLQEVAKAGVEDLTKVKGISRELAQRVYDVFHPDDQ